MKLYKTKGFWVAIAIISIMAFFAIPKCTEIEKREPGTKIEYVHITDTVYVEKIKVVTVKAPIPPAKIIIQKQVDTIYRKEVEKKDIIIGEIFENNKLHIQSIDTLGGKKETITEIPKEAKGFVVDQEGNIEIKERTKVGNFLFKAKKAGKKVGKGALYGLATVGAIAIYLVASGN